VSRKPYEWPALGLVRSACVLGLCALALMAWSILVPTALPVIAALSLGQVLGALAFLAYLLAIVAEIRRHDGALRRADETRDRQAP